MKDHFYKKESQRSHQMVHTKNMKRNLKKRKIGPLKNRCRIKLY